MLTFCSGGGELVKIEKALPNTRYETDFDWQITQLALNPKEVRRRGGRKCISWLVGTSPEAEC